MYSYGYGAPSPDYSKVPKQSFHSPRFSTTNSYSATKTFPPSYSYSYSPMPSPSPSTKYQSSEYYANALYDPSPRQHARHSAADKGFYQSPRQSTSSFKGDCYTPRRSSQYSSARYYSVGEERGETQHKARYGGKSASLYRSSVPGYCEDDARQQSRPSPRKYCAPRPNKTSLPKQPSKAGTTIEAEGRKHKIPPGYSLKNWDPTEEPILLLGSVFDANSLGKWIYDWTVFNHGPTTPIADMAGDLWLLLIKLAGEVQRLGKSVKYAFNDKSGAVNCHASTSRRTPGRLKSALLLMLSSVPGSLGAAIPVIGSSSLDPGGSNALPEMSASISSKESLAIAIAILLFSAKAAIAYRSQTPDLILTISLLLSLWFYSGVIATSITDRGMIVLPLMWIYCTLTALILALVSIYQVHAHHPLKYALLHFISQVLLSGAMAGILVENLDSSWNDGKIQFWAVIPYCFALTIFVVSFSAKLSIWVWEKLNTETKNRISGFFSGPLS